MTWQIVSVIVVALVVLAAAMPLAYMCGRKTGELEGRQAAEEEGPHSAFGDDVDPADIEQGILDAGPDAVIVCDHVGRVRGATSRPEDTDLVDAGRIVNQEILDILQLVDADGEIREREIRVSLDLTRVSDVITGRGITAGAAAPSDRYLRVRIGGISGGLYAVFLNDVTEQRRFEEMRRDFVTNVSHELKTPAGAISLLAETIADASDDPQAVRYFAGRVTKESARLTELVKHLIELQRAQNTNTMLDAKRISTMSVAREAISENIVQANAKHIAIRLSFNGHSQPLEVPAQNDTDASDTESIDNATDVAIVANRETITTAVKNLVENAIRYSPEKTTVVVGVSRDAKRGKVTIHVVDQGIGIPAASLDRVFERFYRVDPARSRATGGSGLGLAITKHCVQESGGTISVWSREGEGSTFTIELPVAPDAAAESDGASAAGAC
ncbi:two-component system sensor histidine kinase [Bifidobacterium goeldii]|uniref:Sensor-like histidine kinase SenX3 n=1 Tax=Bifidobacterium goeldii TaxID=2306975 RepID=A0A430FJI9_9BIFI|nr:ATP-binding protein [Bifidobacterium goeldii]RSX52921.1 two-component system sensor histidine kinase [Bifidobacterium goeldii]